MAAMHYQSLKCGSHMPYQPARHAQTYRAGCGQLLALLQWVLRAEGAEDNSTRAIELHDHMEPAETLLESRHHQVFIDCFRCIVPATGCSARLLVSASNAYSVAEL